jgi:hypothetical protein
MTLDDSFYQQAALLVLGALLTGFGVPCVLRRIDARKLREQKLFEADLARQAKLLEAQSVLLDELTRVVWAWRYLAKQVVYYGSRGDDVRFARARDRYEEGVWTLLDELRTQISKSRRLVSETAFANLNGLYRYIVDDVDRSVAEHAMGPGLDRQGCAELASRFSREVSQRLDEELFMLAQALRLTAPAAPEPPAARLHRAIQGTANETE